MRFVFPSAALACPPPEDAVLQEVTSRAPATVVASAAMVVREGRALGMGNSSGPAGAADRR